MAISFATVTAKTKRETITEITFSIALPQKNFLTLLLSKYFKCMYLNDSQHRTETRKLISVGIPALQFCVWMALRYKLNL